MFLFTILFTVALANIGILCDIVAILISMMSKYKAYMIRDKKRIASINKLVTYTSFTDEDQNPLSFIIGKNFFGFIFSVRNQHINALDKTLCLMTHRDNFKEICSTYLEKLQEDQDTNIRYWYRSGNYWELFYSKRMIEANVTPDKRQQKIVKSVTQYYKKHKKGVFFISGDPGNGKSTMLRILGNHYKSDICKTLRLTDPGDFMEKLYNHAEPTEDKPLIVLFDEIDTMIHSVDKGEVFKHKCIPTQIFDKTSYNTFFDEVADGMYPFLIILLTSNKTAEEIAKENHECYLRKERVNGYYIL